MGDETPRATLGERDGSAPVRERPPDDAFERIALLPVDKPANPLPQCFLGSGEQRRGLRECGRAGQAKADPLRRIGQKGQRDAGRQHGEGISNQLGEDAFARTDRQHRAVPVRGGSPQRGESRRESLRDNRFHFIGHAGQQGHGAPLDSLTGNVQQSRRGADRVVDRLKSRRDMGHRLPLLRERDATLFEIPLEMTKNGRIRLHGQTERSGNGELGHVIMRGPQTTRQNDDFRIGERLFEGNADFIQTVAHGHGSHQGDSQRIELLTEPGGIGVDDLPDQQFVSNRDEYGTQRESSSVIEPNPEAPHAVMPAAVPKYGWLVYFPGAGSMPKPAGNVSAFPRTWNESFRIRSIETDADGRLKLESICNYFQEAAGNHAHDLGVATDQLTEHGLAWVLGRLCFSVTGSPQWRDTARIETWPSGVDRLYAFRDFMGYSDAHGLFVEGISTWLLIDVVRRRPVRMPEFVTQLPLPDRPRALQGILPASMEPEGPPVMEKSFEVYRSDIDVNRHVNNVRFLGWILETLPARPPTDWGKILVDLSFRAEAVYGDPIRVRSWDRSERGVQADQVFVHGVFHGESDRLLASAVTTWTPLMPR